MKQTGMAYLACGMWIFRWQCKCHRTAAAHLRRCRRLAGQQLRGAIQAARAADGLPPELRRNRVAHLLPIRACLRHQHHGWLALLESFGCAVGSRLCPRLSPGCAVLSVWHAVPAFSTFWYQPVTSRPHTTLTCSAEEHSLQISVVQTSFDRSGHAPTSSLIGLASQATWLIPQSVSVRRFEQHRTTHPA
jgi:hypothetical protein